MNNIVSVICVYNDKEILENNLALSLKEQKEVDYELVLVNNTNGRFDNMSKAYNFGFSLSKGSILVFSHQDVVLGDDYFLHNICNWFKYNDLKNFGLAGLIGVEEDGNVRGLVKVNDTINGIPVDHPTEVLSVDDFLLITIRKSFIKAGKFDENLPGWHGYSMDLSLMLRKVGLHTFVIPFFAVHNSYNKAIEKSNLEKSLKYVIGKNKGSILYHPAYKVEENEKIIMPGKIYESRIFSILKSIFYGTETKALIIISVENRNCLHYPEFVNSDFSKYFEYKIRLQQTYLIIDKTNSNYVHTISNDSNYSVVIVYSLYDEKITIERGPLLVSLLVRLKAVDLFFHLMRKIAGFNYSRVSYLVLISQILSKKFR